ncbi:GNAT family N-acetyltransferase [Streptomyces brasiliensis]|nr:GNAT family N-acetyltransferase [Streptomyces brasiliensis]
MAFSTSPDSGSAIRPYRPDDGPWVRELIDADRLPGQPHCTAQKLAAAQHGALSSAGWVIPVWPQISVLADAEDRPCGIIGYLSWTDVDTGLICWVHAREDGPALGALLGQALAALAHCPRIDAFAGASPGLLGPGGLPRTHRGATHDTLVQYGFTGLRSGRYLHRGLPAEAPPAKLVADVFPCDVPPGHRLIIREAAEPIAEAVVSAEADRTATVHWIETLPTHRRRGLGRKLLAQALALLAEQGATEVALVLDDAQQPASESQAATRLFHSFGFTHVDQLWTYQHRRPRAPRPGT